MSAEEPAGLLLQRGGQTSVMSNVDLGQLHAELKKQGVEKSVKAGLQQSAESAFGGSGHAER